MKKILITGANSYVGTSFEKWISRWPKEYEVHTLDMKDEQWRKNDFNSYDTVFHVAGIAHADAGKVNEEEKKNYFKINRDLTIEVAEKAKEEKVKQFIYMSSIIVYGESGKIGEEKVISNDTLPKPANFYGESKLQGEKGILSLSEKNFKVVILRPPMIYGKGSKGNYSMLAKFAKKLPIFPDIENQRSMLYIDNLCEFVRLMIANKEEGIFFPQNKDYVKTSEMVKVIAEVHGKKIRLIKVFNPMIKELGNYVSFINKAFGNLVYMEELSFYKENYQINCLGKSILLTEDKNG
ncbi:MAG: NAD-dependent epimerase/dehydratase family protein [Eubacteriaceae bacterium]